jgi:AhpD family alkylhydroperoxidase
LKTQRLDAFRTHPESLNAMKALQGFVDHCGIEASLLELVKIRASQINACAYCLDMHMHEARKLGETQQRLDTLAAWQEAPFFSDKERIALTWTEALTRLSNPSPISDLEYETALKQFTPQELVALTTAVIAINGWNRLCIAFQTQPEKRSVDNPTP